MIHAELSPQRPSITEEQFAHGLLLLHNSLTINQRIGKLIREQKTIGLTPEKRWEKRELTRVKPQALIDLLEYSAEYENPLGLIITLYSYPSEILFEESANTVRIEAPLYNVKNNRPDINVVVQSSLDVLRREGSIATSLQAKGLLERAVGERLTVDNEPFEDFMQRTYDEALRKCSQEMFQALFAKRLNVWMRQGIHPPAGYGLIYQALGEPGVFAVMIMRDRNSAAFQVVSRELFERRLK